MRLSPSLISGMNRCAMTLRAPKCAIVSMITLRLTSSRRTRKIDDPPMPSSGFRMTSPCSSMKPAMSSRVARDQRRHGELGKLGDRPFFVVIANRARAVDDVRAFVLGSLEQVRGVDILHVERRILAHQHRVEPGQRYVRGSRCAIPVVVVGAHLGASDARLGDAAAPTRRSTSPRAGAGVRRHRSNPRAADATARSTSAAFESGKRPIRSRVSAGLRFSKYSPLAGAHQAPAMKF